MKSFKLHPNLSFLIVLVALTAGFETAGQTILKARGHVSLGDGRSPSDTKITLKVDLNDDGKLAKYETATGFADASGNYKISLSLNVSSIDFDLISDVSDLISTFDSGGFEALVKGGPLTVILRFEKSGYATWVRTFSTNLGTVKRDVRLAPLDPLYCSRDTCSSADDGVRLSGLLGDSGIVEGYAKAYDPLKDKERFPGTFSDASNNLLISSGFIAVDLRDKNNKPISSLDEPATVSFRLDEASWHTLVDKQADSGAIEVPMYSFDEKSAEWIAEENGVLVDAEGAMVDEDELSRIRDGSFSKALFVRFETKHFSYWNVDEPVKAHACIKGRLVDADGNAVGGVNVVVSGVSYSGSAPGMTTSANGYFAAGMMKSEGADEDLDYNGIEAETFQAELQITGSAGGYIFGAFDTPGVSSKIVDKGGINCVPQDCPCEDLGDVTVTLEPPTLCEVTVAVAFNGKTSENNYDGKLDSGAVANVSVSGDPLGAAAMPPLTADLCADRQCYGAKTDADGSATFFVPQFGGTGKLRLSVGFQRKRDDGDYDVYTGEVEIAACADGETRLSGEMEIEVTHSVAMDIGDFIAELFEGGEISVESGSNIGGCICTVGPGTRAGKRFLPFLLMLVALGVCYRLRQRF